MYNNECNKIMTCNNDKYIEVNFINNCIVFDTLIDEEYITINKIDDLFIPNYLNSELQQNENDVVVNNCILEPHDEEICSQSLFFENDNKNNDLCEKNKGTVNIEVNKLNTAIERDHFELNLITSKYNETDDDLEEDEDINNQITEYREELIMIETEINILNNSLL